MAAANTAAAGGGSGTSSTAASPSSVAAAAAERAAERESMFRWRDRQYYGPKRWLESALRDSGTWADGKDEETKKRDSSSGNNKSPLWLGDELVSLRKH